MQKIMTLPYGVSLNELGRYLFMPRRPTLVFLLITTGNI